MIEKKKLYLNFTILRLLLEMVLPFYVIIREPREGLAVCREKVVPSFHSYFETLSIVPASGVDPAISRSAVKRSTD